MSEALPIRYYDLINIEIADDGMAPEIERLSKANHFEFEGWEIDWSQVYPSWLVASIDDVVVGCVQVLPGIPLGRLEFLSVDMNLDREIRREIARKMALAGMESLKAQGGQGAAATVPYDRTGFHDLVEELGGSDINEGWIMVMRSR